MAAQNATAIVDSIVDRLTEIYPPSAVGTKMSDSSGNGQFQAIRVEVDAVKGQVDAFKEDINRRFSGLSDDIHNLGLTLNQFIRDQSSKGGESLLKVLGLVGGAISIALVIVGAFGSLAKVNLDTNIAYTNKAIDQTNTNVDKLAETMAKNVVPRNEFTARVEPISDEMRHQSKIQDYHSTQIATAIAEAAALKADVERMKGDIVTRRENEGHWDDFQNRMNLLSNRVNDLAKISGGGDLVEQLKQLRDQFNALQGKFINVPSQRPAER